LINVLLVDDHELVRAGIRRILEDIKGIKVAGEACCGEDAVKWCRTHSADVVLMDMNMPGIGGLEATRKIARAFVDTKVIMLTVHTEGRAVCGVYTRDVAETKAMQVNQYARECQHPLLCEIEKDG